MKKAGQAAYNLSGPAAEQGRWVPAREEAVIASLPPCALVSATGFFGGCDWQGRRPAASECRPYRACDRLFDGRMPAEISCGGWPGLPRWRCRGGAQSMMSRLGVVIDDAAFTRAITHKVRALECTSDACWSHFHLRFLDLDLPGCWNTCRNRCR